VFAEPRAMIRVFTGGSLQRRAAGFSLAELVVVLAIGAVLASSVGISYHGRTLARRRVEAAAARVVADIDLTRQQAIQASSPRTMAFTGNNYAIAGVAHLDRSNIDYAVNLADNPYLAKVDSVDFGGDAVIKFNIYGLPDSGGQMVISVGDYTKKVTLDSKTGLASSQ
jgi:prepilin-type N-terminal cleavage/methylation domain-containing protein